MSETGAYTPPGPEFPAYPGAVGDPYLQSAQQPFPGDPYAQGYPGQEFPVQPYPAPGHPGQVYPAPHSRPYAPTPANSPWATTSLICGILGVCCGVTAPLALGFGIAGLVQIQNNPEQHGGKGMAIAGTALGAVMTVVLILIFIN